MFITVGLFHQDLVTTKPMTSDEFTKLVENSQSGLTGRPWVGHWEVDGR